MSTDWLDVYIRCIYPYPQLSLRTYHQMYPYSLSSRTTRTTFSHSVQRCTCRSFQPVPGARSVKAVQTSTSKQLSIAAAVSQMSTSIHHRQQTQLRISVQGHLDSLHYLFVPLCLRTFLRSSRLAHVLCIIGFRRVRLCIVMYAEYFLAMALQPAECFNEKTKGTTYMYIARVQ